MHGFDPVARQCLGRTARTFCFGNRAVTILPLLNLDVTQDCLVLQPTPSCPFSLPSLSRMKSATSSRKDFAEQNWPPVAYNDWSSNEPLVTLDRSNEGYLQNFAFHVETQSIAKAIYAGPDLRIVFNPCGLQKGNHDASEQRNAPRVWKLAPLQEQSRRNAVPKRLTTGVGKHRRLLQGAVPREKLYGFLNVGDGGV